MIKNILSGFVIRNPNNKTVIVSIIDYFNHPIYKKIIKQNKLFIVQDPKNTCKIGDKVLITKIQPVSK
jgi:small subunit ribosomal protein S17